MIDNSLKPCPFCGGSVEKKLGYTGLRMFHCVKCDAVISFLHHERDPAATACYNNRPKQTVVRCKDCKWWMTNYSWNGKREHKICMKEKYQPIRNPDDYCSRGERKDDETD